jgi:eukaryotic-like serine/threonine-protein kinase
MKQYLQKPIVKKILLTLLGLLIFIILLDQLFLPWYVSSPETEVPKVVGLKEADAVFLLEGSDLEPVVGDTTYDAKYPKGTVVLQKPPAGHKVKEGRRVYLFISGGDPVVKVPLLKGRSLRDAKLSLERLGLRLGYIDEVPSQNPKDMIFDQQYAEGTTLKQGESVGVSISLGESSQGAVVVPDLIGKSLSEAERILSESSLKVGKINYQRSFSLLPNTILDQYPSKGSRLNNGDAVDLFVTRAGEPGQDDIIEE